MNFTVEQECPQCGGRIELDEADHLIHCPHCNVRNFIFSGDYSRFYLPSQSTNRNLIYAPYMRFKGVVFSCEGTSVKHRIVDITLQGSAVKQLPLSLGFRPQALKMRFVSSDIEGIFLHNTVTSNDVMNDLETRRSITSSGKVLHRAYIGEVVTCIYLPLFVKKDQMFDAVVNKTIAKVFDYDNVLTSAIDTDPYWTITFMPTLCPNCGWDLAGERDSVVLTCSNCDSAWEPSKGTFIRTEIIAVPGGCNNTVHLPFWKWSAEDTDFPIVSYTDFIRVTGQPMIVQELCQEMLFWIPAFKIRPNVFLRLARQMTITRMDFPMMEESVPKNVYPVTLSRNEAAQAIKIAFASSVVNKKSIFPLLPQINFTMKNSTLTFLPFIDTGHELIQQQMRFAIRKNTLKFGRNL